VDIAKTEELVHGYDFSKVMQAYWRGFHLGNDDLKNAAMKWLPITDEERAATNRLVMALGTNISLMARSGEDFAELAKRFSEEDEHEGVEWGVFYAHEIEDPKIRKTAFELPVGGVSDPLDTDEGMYIIKVLERAGTGDGKPQTVRLARIYRRLMRGGEDLPLPSRDEIRRAYLNERISDIQPEMLRPLREAARIEYPNGTNFWPAAKSPRRQTIPHSQKTQNPQPQNP